MVNVRKLPREERGGGEDEDEEEGAGEVNEEDGTDCVFCFLPFVVYFLSLCLGPFRGQGDQGAPVESAMLAGDGDWVICKCQPSLSLPRQRCPVAG